MRVAPALWAGLGLTGLLAGTVSAMAATNNSTPSPPPASRPAKVSSPGTEAYAHQRLSWGRCSPEQEELRAAGAECAKVTVPLDYSEPRGRTIEIAISRVKAPDRAHRRGILLSNPGGPGGPGLAYTLGLRPALKDVAARYDLIGFDPRFLGESTPIRCAPAEPAPPPGAETSAREQFDRQVRSAREDARRCHSYRDNADLLSHASSRNVARDMDLIRAVLGERRMSYFGVSYGADLGAVYTQMFPRRTDRFVIDSSTDPAATQYELFQGSGRYAEEGLDEWAAWTARHNGTYGLGSSATAVRAEVQALLDQTERRRLTLAGVPLDASVVRMVLKQSVQHTEQNAVLAGIVRDLVNAADGKPVEPGPELTAMLELLKSPELADSMVGGAIFMCGDGGWPAGGWPADPETYWQNIVRSRGTEPVFGPYVNGMIAPCAFWKSRPQEPGTRIGNDRPVLMLQARRDNNVPYDGALALHRRLTGSRLVTAEVRAHGVFGRGVDGMQPVPCADRAVNDYLRSGDLPARDYTCEPGESE